HPWRVTPKGETFELRTPAAVLDTRAQSHEGLLSFLSARAPNLAEQVKEWRLAERAQRNVARLLSAILASGERFQQARENPAQFRRALEVASASEFLSELLVHHPENLVALGEDPGARASGPAQFEIPLEPLMEHSPFAWVHEPNLDAREKTALLRRDFRSQVLALGAADLLEWKSVFPALEAWSLLGRRAVASALEIAAASAGERASGASGRIPLVVLGLGRLGLNEFDLASDADLVFALAEGADHGDLPFATRIAEKTIEVLSSYTRDGTVFVVDTRLRPRGEEGELVVTEGSLLTYLEESAQVWEGLTYLKATPVAGDGKLARRVSEKASAICLERFSKAAHVEDELRKMRRRLETEVIVPPTNVKTVPGGYYDVDFVVSLLRLRERIPLDPGTSMRSQVEALRSGGLLGADDARAFSEGMEFLRALDHAVRLATGKPMTGFPEHVGHAEAVEKIAARWGLIEEGESVTERLYEHQQKVRHVYRKVFGHRQEGKSGPIKVVGT
ncbi:MAG TPA: hypothetical protein VFM21_01660, partial [Terriglobia bacterium]|nr:hypothetical protein [Terriglobia bacterium]